MMGVYLTVDGNNKKHVKTTRQVIYTWFEKVCVGHLLRYDAWSSFYNTVMNTLEHPLLVLTLTDIECNIIMTPMMTGGLPRMGISRNMDRKICYGLMQD